jgi:hypothetical protein
VTSYMYSSAAAGRRLGFGVVGKPEFHVCAQRNCVRRFRGNVRSCRDDVAATVEVCQCSSAATPWCKTRSSQRHKLPGVLDDSPFVIVSGEAADSTQARENVMAVNMTSWPCRRCAPPADLVQDGRAHDGGHVAESVGEQDLARMLRLKPAGCVAGLQSAGISGRTCIPSAGSVTIRFGRAP